MAVRQLKLQQSPCRNGSHFLTAKGSVFINKAEIKIHSSSFVSTNQASQNQSQIKRSTSLSSTLQHLKRERNESGGSKIPEKSRKMAILAGKNEALARISNYSSDEEPVVKKPVEKEDDLMISYKKREEKKRKRKFNTEGSFWSFGKVREPNRSLFMASF